MSRLSDIRDAVETIVIAAFAAEGETVKTSEDPDSMEELETEDMPFARIIFIEEEPEALTFKQQRRRVVGEVAIAMFSETLVRETVDSRIQSIRDLIFDDDTLGSLVDDITAEAGVTVSNPEEPKIFGNLEITTEEVF